MSEVVLAVGDRWVWNEPTEMPPYREITNVYGGEEPGVTWRSPWTHGFNYTSRKGFLRWIERVGARRVPAPSSEARGEAE